MCSQAFGVWLTGAGGKDNLGEYLTRLGLREREDLTPGEKTAAIKRGYRIGEAIAKCRAKMLKKNSGDK